MNFFTSSTFRTHLVNLTKKQREGYMSVVKDICDQLKVMDDKILRESNDRVRQLEDFRIVKLRLPNSGQNLSKSNGFRLIYWVSLLADEVVLMSIFPKRGPQSAVNLVDAEYTRLVEEMTTESQNNSLHQVDIHNSLAELSTATSLSHE